MVKIETIILPDVRWAEQFSDQKIIGASEISRAGTSIYWESELIARQMTLQGGSDTAFISRADFEAIDALIQIGAAYNVEYDGKTYLCRFRTEDPPVLSATPANRFKYPGAGDKLNNLTIKMMIIG